MTNRKPTDTFTCLNLQRPSIKHRIETELLTMSYRTRCGLAPLISSAQLSKGLTGSPVCPCNSSKADIILAHSRNSSAPVSLGPLFCAIVHFMTFPKSRPLDFPSLVQLVLSLPGSHYQCPSFCHLQHSPDSHSRLRPSQCPEGFTAQRSRTAGQPLCSPT